MTLKRFLFCFLTAFATFACYSTFATDAFSSIESNDDEFLRVEEAYQVLLQTDGADEPRITMDWSIAAGYYLYQHQFKLTARNQTESVDLPLSFEPGKIKFDEYFNKDLEVYYYNTRVTAPSPDLTPPYELVAQSQGCADAGLCYPPRKQYFQVSDSGEITETETAQYDPITAPTESTTEVTTDNPPAEEQPFLPLILLGALLGGMILNLMPCVFPVLSLKALSMSASHLSAHKQHLHGWAYTAGVVGSFMVAAIMILVARATGETLGWGFQLQRPEFVALMAYLFFIMGLSLSGMFYVGMQWMGAGQGLTSGHGLQSSFFTGVLAAVVASPCTAPFMATALGVALTQPALISLLIFIALGFGMALPFLLLSYSPKMAQMMPAPGQWMENLKQFLAFPLYATCVWLLWVLGHQVSSDGAAMIVLGGVAIAFGIWLLNVRAGGFAKTFNRALAVTCFIFALLLAFRVEGFREPANPQWEPYSSSRLEELRNQGTPVLVDFTADWCITCKVNERVALNTEEVIAKAQSGGIVLMMGDWTNTDPEISDVLNRFGRSGVPLYLMYPATAGSDPEILPQILTKGLVLEAMDRALQ